MPSTYERMLVSITTPRERTQSRCSVLIPRTRLPVLSPFTFYGTSHLPSQTYKRVRGNNFWELKKRSFLSINCTHDTCIHLTLSLLVFYDIVTTFLTFFHLKLSNVAQNVRNAWRKYNFILKFKVCSLFVVFCSETVK